MLIGWSVVVSGAVVTSLQYFGYLVALVGVTMYSAYKRAQQRQMPSLPKELELPIAAKQDCDRGAGTAEEQRTLSCESLATDEDEV